MAEQLIQMEVSAEELVAFFTTRFSEHYGAGHLVLACHAAFPVSITVDLLYQTWANFKTFTDSRGVTQTIPMLAVSDLLLSSLFRQTGRDLYEMWPAVRALLLEKLKSDFGEQRLRLLAQFLQLYIDQLPDRPEWKNFREAQHWTALMVTDPRRATRSLLQSLIDKVGKSQVSTSIGITNMIESFVNNDPGFMRDLSKHLEAGTSVSGDGPTSKRLVITDQPVPGKAAFNLPAYISQRLQGNRELVQRIERPQPPDNPPLKGQLHAVVIGVDQYPSQPFTLKAAVSDATSFANALLTIFQVPAENIHSLLDSFANEAAVHDLIADTLHEAESRDTVIIYFAGHAENEYERNALAFFDYVGPHTATGRVSDNEMREWAKRYAYNDPNIVLILDTHAGSRQWLEEDNPKHVQLMASHKKENTYEEEGTGGYFTYTLLQMFQDYDKPMTYRQLYRNIMSNMQQRINGGSFIQTPLFVMAEENWDKEYFSNEPVNITRQTQHLLQECGYKVVADGVAGPATAAAVDSFMYDHGLRDPDRLIHYLKLKAEVFKQERFPILLLLSGPDPGFGKIFDSREFELRTWTIPDLRSLSNFDQRIPPKPADELTMRSQIQDAAAIILALDTDHNNPTGFVEEVHRILDMAFALDKEVLLASAARAVAPLNGGMRYIPIVWNMPDGPEKKEDNLHEASSFKLFLGRFLARKTPEEQIHELGDLLYQAAETHMLDCSNFRLETIPREVFGITGLRQLYLEGNNIKIIPADIGQLGELEVLNLNGNPIEQLPPELLTLRSLKILALDNTPLRYLPEKIDMLESLEELHIHGSDVTILPENLINITTLNELDARECKVLNVPKKVLYHTNAPARLRTYWKGLRARKPAYSLLLLSDKPEDIVPVELLLTRTLGAALAGQWLKIDKVKDLPALFAALFQTAAQECLVYIVDRKGSLFTGLPENGPAFFGALPMSSLNILYESNLSTDGLYSLLNELTLTNSFFATRTADSSVRFIEQLLRGGSVQNIDTTGVAFNITRKPNFVDFRFPRSLTANISAAGKLSDPESIALNLSGYKLDEIPGADLETAEYAVGVTSMDISDNRISTIPDAIANLVNLKKFTADRLPDLTELPEAFYKLTKLEEISVASSGLRWLSRSIRELKELRTLTIDSTNIKVLPIELSMLPNLKIINAGNNKFINVPERVLAKHNAAELKEYFTRLPERNGLPKILHFANDSQPLTFSEPIRKAITGDTAYNVETYQHPDWGLLDVLTGTKPEINQRTLIVLDDNTGEWSQQFGEGPARYHNIYQYFASFVYPVNIIYNGWLANEDALRDLLTSGAINSFVIKRQNSKETGLPNLLAELMIHSGISYLEALKFVERYRINRRGAFLLSREKADLGILGYNVYYDAQRFVDFTLLSRQGRARVQSPELVAAHSSYAPAISQKTMARIEATEKSRSRSSTSVKPKPAPQKAAPKTTPSKKAAPKKTASKNKAAPKRAPQTKQGPQSKKRKGPPKKK